jgi:hypothetical protein
MDKSKIVPAFPKGWLKRELDEAVREVASWSPGMRRANEGAKPNAA